MAELNRSTKALDNLALFHRKKFIVYIEGDDDKPFWKRLFNQFGLRDYHFKIAGGKGDIEKLSKAIIEEDANIVVTRDCDYSDILNEQYDHKRIIYTYGYSIENTLYCPESIADLVSIFVKEDAEDIKADEVERWLTVFVSDFERLIVLDIANEKFQKGEIVLGNNCNRFLESQKACKPSVLKIRNYIYGLESSFTSEEIRQAQVLLDETKKDLIHVVRGHFLTAAVRNYIVSKTKIKSLSNDEFYRHMINNFCHHCIERADYKYLESQITRLGVS